MQPASGMVSVAVRDSLIVGNSATGLLATATLAGDVANVSIESTAAMRNGSSGFAASTSVGTVNLVVSSSASIDNGGNGVLAFGYATVSVSASTLSRNAGPGLVQTPGAVLRSHGNNAADANSGGETQGTITSVGLI